MCTVAHCTCTHSVRYIRTYVQTYMGDMYIHTVHAFMVHVCTYVYMHISMHVLSVFGTVMLSHQQ